MLAHLLNTDKRIINEQTRAGWGSIIEICLRPFVLLASFIGIYILMHVTDIVVVFTGNFLASMLNESTINFIAVLAIMAILILIAIHVYYERLTS